MLKRFCLFVVVLSFGVTSACASGEAPRTIGGDDTGTIEEEDVGGGDVVEADAGDVDLPDADQDTGPTFKPPEFYHSTSGGGLSTSGQFKLQMNFGAPMPRGTSSNSEYRLRFGPVSP